MFYYLGYFLKYVFEDVALVVTVRLKKGIRSDNTFRSNFVKMKIALAILPWQSLADKSFIRPYTFFKMNCNYL